MSRCKEVLKSVVTGKTVLVCDLDDCHENSFPDHFDKVENVEWRQREDPSRIPALPVIPDRTEYASV